MGFGFHLGFFSEDLTRNLNISVFLGFRLCSVLVRFWVFEVSVLCSSQGRLWKGITGVVLGLRRLGPFVVGVEPKLNSNPYWPNCFFNQTL